MPKVCDLCENGEDVLTLCGEYWVCVICLDNIQDELEYDRVRLDEEE